ncbi:hypothetical protein [Glycomyces sp. NPDC047010]|uniref:hypothetical protein n=1 Tax=Glycomyces sp. NPDC047010 TaxID=3155023 RepID=UPI0033E97693
MPSRTLAAVPAALLLLGLAACSVTLGSSEEPSEDPATAESSSAEAQPSQEESSAPPADDSQSLAIEASRLAAASEDALEAQLGYRPEIDCGEVNIMIYVDRQTYCSLIDTADGAEYQVTITVTSIEGQEFNFDIAVDDVPQG